MKNWSNGFAPRQKKLGGKPAFLVLADDYPAVEGEQTLPLSIQDFL